MKQPRRTQGLVSALFMCAVVPIISASIVGWGSLAILYKTLSGPLFQDWLIGSAMFALTSICVLLIAFGMRMANEILRNHLRADGTESLTICRSEDGSLVEHRSVSVPPVAKP